MTWVVTAAVISTAGSVYSANQAGKAAEAQGAAALAAGRRSTDAANQIRSDLSPFTTGGANAFNQLLGFSGVQQGDPQAQSFGREFPTQGVATERDVQEAFTTYLGREPTQEEVDYYTGKRSSAGSPPRERAGELFRTIVAPNKERVDAQLAAQAPAASAPQAADPFGTNTQMEFLRTHPLFQLGLQNLNEATNARAASQGRFGSGDTATEIFSNALAAGGPLLNQRFSQLLDLSRMGQSSAAQAGTFSANAASNAGNALLQGGNAVAAGIIGRNNAIASGVEGVISQLPAIISGFQNRGQSQPPPSNSFDLYRPFVGGNT